MYRKPGPHILRAASHAGQEHNLELEEYNLTKKMEEHAREKQWK